jgi:hypothetical protein
MRRRFTNLFGPGTSEWDEHGPAYPRAGGLGGPMAMAALLALVVVLLFAPIWHRVALSWSQSAAQVELAGVWTKALTDLDLQPEKTLLTSFHGTWNPDESLASLQFTAETSDRLQLVVFAEPVASSGDISVLAGKNGYADPSWASFGAVQPDTFPDVKQVLSSLDGAGIAKLAKAFGASLGGDEVFQLDFAGDPGQVAPGGYPLLAVAAGQISSLSAPPENAGAQPGFWFSATKVQTDGGQPPVSLGSVLVR